MDQIASVDYLMTLTDGRTITMAGNVEQFWTQLIDIQPSVLTPPPDAPEIDSNQFFFSMVNELTGQESDVAIASVLQPQPEP